MSDMRLLVPLALLGIGLPGASQPPAATPSAPGDTLVVAVVHENGSLIPIARYAGGAWGDGVRTFRWLGFLGIQGLVAGVVHGKFREGESFFVVELDGAASRILARLYGGGC